MIKHNNNDNPFSIAVHNIPPPDYDSTPRSQGSHQPTIVMEEKDTCYEGDERQDSLSPEQIRSMMSREQKELQRDLKIMQKRYNSFQLIRPNHLQVTCVSFNPCQEGACLIFFICSHYLVCYWSNWDEFLNNIGFISAFQQSEEERFEAEV